MQTAVNDQVHIGLRRTCWGVGLTQGGAAERCWGKLRVRWAAGCIPSARVQPKHLMKSESAVRSEHFRRNNALSVIPPFPTPLILPFLSLCCPSLGSFMWGQEWWLLWAPLTRSGSLWRNNPFASHHTLLAWAPPHWVRDNKCQHF